LRDEESIVTEVMEATSSYLADFDRLEKELAAVGTPALHRLRKAAAARFAELGFPGPRDEEWRFTPLSALLGEVFEVPPSDVAEAAESFRLLGHDGAGGTLLAANRNRPFLLNGSQPLPDGVIVCSLVEALEKHPHLVEPHLGRHADFKGHGFTAINTAFLRDGVFVYVPAGKVVEGPIRLQFLVSSWNERGPYVWHRRCLVVVGDNAQAKFVEAYHGIPGCTYFTNAVTEVVLGAGAVLDHCKHQQEGDHAFHMATMQVHLGRAANFASHSIALGGRWVRNEVNAVFGGEGGECTLNGLYHATGHQLVDNHTFIDHAHPHCNSHELYKGILDGKGRGVFNGKIYVRQDAQKTDAKQTNQTLLLSDEATIDTKPQLEIYADDVKCTHGATVGQLDAESLFYLRSRGIGAEQARALLTYAFANDIISRIKVASLRRQLEQTFLAAQHLPAATDEEWS
jgi:Fe-S cluster assembly protein SufD